MMLKQHALLSIALLSSAQIYAVPIESRGLSQPAANMNNIEGSQSPIAGNLNWDLIQKNQQLETQLRELRGKMEEQDHQIDQLNKELTNRYTDLDQRLELLQQKVDPDSQVQEEEASGQTPEAPTDTPAANSVTPPANPPAPENPAPAAENTNTSNTQELEKAAYTIALDAYKKGGAKQAIAPMKNFIKSYPNSIYTGNAYFWLAEFNLAIDPPNYNEAKKNYEMVASKFPNSAKAPRALYQLYSIAKDVNKNNASATVYKNKLLTTYPKSEEAGYFKKA
ncbi:TolA-binding protein [Acinetobacter calcoaceticus]|uniref:TolA-binding protein n=1 Tax=Acinetobacter calcoaceticus TaxID=471 RepID=A0A4R1Y0W3_ACICA|nr:TolA-binding protein [Acinetobacter calcoaceticus]